MKINEIPINSAITLEISKDKTSVEVSSEVAQVVSNGIVLQPITVDGRTLNLEGNDFKVSLIYGREGQKPLLWRNITYKTLRQGNTPIVVLLDNREGTEYNRRSAFRLDMDVAGVTSTGDKVIIHDISKTGISFYTAIDNAKEIGSTLSIRFMGGYEELVVTCKIVRKQECEERMLHGCSFSSNLKVEKFVAEEQMRRARKRSGK